MSSEAGGVEALNETLARLADANVHAAELLVELELTKQLLEEQNRDLAAARAAAEESGRCKSAFLANMSHELRTPLNAIIGYSELLLEDPLVAAQSQLADDVGRIRSAGRHLLALVNDVLDLSKVEAGRMHFEIETVPVSPLLQEIETLAKPLMAANRNVFEIARPERELCVRVDKLRMRQCLLNLLSNAAKFTVDGLVRLVVEPDGAVVHWHVQDTGVGIDAAHMPLLFQSFVQVPTARTLASGTGLGLAICRQVCRSMGGDVTATSTLGAGSVFTLSVRQA